MTLSSNMNALQIGQLLMIETQDEILIGNLKVFDPNWKVIELSNVRDFKTNYVYTSSQILPLPQIRTIKMIDTDEETETSSTSGSNNNTADCSWTSASPLHHKRRVCHHINLTSHELKLIQDQLSNTIYISQTDQSYHKALAEIKAQGAISVLLEPMEYGRNNRTSLLTVGTPRAVYIFDILSLGKVFREMKAILESKVPRKVMHYSNRIFDNLKHRQNVDMAGVFDTFVAHCLITGVKANVSLLETIQYYFNIPALYFSEDCQTRKTSSTAPMDPYIRPLAKEFLQLMAKRAIFQLKLYDYLLHEQMLSIFYQQCDKYSTASSSTTDLLEAATQLTPNSRKGFQHIRPKQEGKVLLDKQF